ncbi:Importin subunit alpha-1 [Amphibalanus amphitrite]|uniref:Importin subunit alpha-1 n=1 Tax=Amphibalanus amphitrite TaxID=1232801 RepID=A0A6A4WPI1_AMPAM|nr:Importin subunit alpha-1 [Amphibalanus amphitrite]
MEELLAARSRLRTKATKACNDLRAYREGDRKTLDPDQLALKLHHVEKIQTDVIVDVLEMLQKDDYRSQREAVRVMVILNLTSGGSQELVAELCRLGAARPRCDLLAAGDVNLIMVFLDALSNVLRCAEQVDREGTVALQVDECGGLDRIESLQTYEDEPSSSSAGTSTMTTRRTLRWRRPPPPPMASS